MDTTLRSLPQAQERNAERLVAIVVAGEVLASPRAFAIPRGHVEIGRAVGPEALGLAADARLSRRHARLERGTNGELLLSALGTSPIDVRGEESRTATLVDGDVVVLGHTILVVRTFEGPRDAPTIEGLVGDAPSVRAIRRSIAKVGPSALSVVLLGESGTGKEVVARALHEQSGRKGELIALNCAAIPATLAEAQLFGHAAGAFTGASRPSAGLFRAAHGGTLFLDEVGDLPLELQPKLLRALEERAVVAVGTATPTKVDVRVVAATNKDLIEEVRAGRFRGDLYARLAEHTIELPRLRERPEDVLPLLRHLMGGSLPALTFDVLRALLVHPWPFNVRELRTVATQLRLALPHDGPIPLRAIASSLEGTARLVEQRPTVSGSEPPAAPTTSPPEASSAPPSKSELEALLRAHRGNVTFVARASGRSRKQVYRWLETHGVDPARFRDDE